MKNTELTVISGIECCQICGGAVDKNAQKALYYIGYALGVAVKVLGGMFAGCERQVETAK